jgi:hypothetical protein
MNKDVSRSIIQRSVGLASGVATTLAVPFFLSPEQQGYFYTFSSVLAIQVFFELGLGQVLLYKFSSYAAAGPDLLIPGKSLELQSLLYTSRRIYIVITLLFCLVASVVGLIFFSHSGQPSGEWRPQWLFLVFVTSINLMQSIKLVFLESHGRVADVATLRLKSNILSTVLLFAILLLRGGLWAVTVVPSVNAIATTWWIYISSKSVAYRQHRKLEALVSLREMRKIWMQDIFPLQWRMSLSWLSGYFIFQLITPIAFSRFGPVVAGQLGFAITAMNSILLVATTFTTATAPRLSSLFHSGRIRDYNLLFDRSLLISLSAVVILSALFVLTIYSVSLMNAEFASRFLSWKLLFLYSLTVVVSAMAFCLSIYLRSQAIEPLVLPSILAAAIMAPSIWAFSYVSLSAMLIAMLFVTFVSAFAVWRIYSLNRRRLVGQCL